MLQGKIPDSFQDATLHIETFSCAKFQCSRKYFPLPVLSCHFLKTASIQPESVSRAWKWYSIFTLAFIGSEGTCQIAELAPCIPFIWDLGKSTVKPLYPPFHILPFISMQNVCRSLQTQNAEVSKCQWFKGPGEKMLGSLQPFWRLQVNQKEPRVSDGFFFDRGIYMVSKANWRLKCLTSSFLGFC